MRTGIFGGTFNPPHQGHLNSVRSVAKELQLDRVLVIPSHQSPGRERVEAPTFQQRLEMTRVAFQQESPKVQVDDRELVRGGVSYTIETLKSLEAEGVHGELFLIIGMDQFENFAQWKSAGEILEKANLVVTSRPGIPLPLDREELLPEISKRVVSRTKFQLDLNTGKKIYFLQLKDIDISASELRRQLHLGGAVTDLLPQEVEKYIEEKNLYAPLRDKVLSFQDFSLFCAQVLNEKKAINVVAKDMRKFDKPMEFALIASGTSRRHTLALAEHVIESAKDKYNIRPIQLEGTGEGRWIVVDYGSLMIHIFYDFIRQEYHLEDLWKNADTLPLSFE